MAFDQERYRERVLEPARSGGGVPPADLVARYDLDAGALRGDAAFEARVAEVVNYWRTLKHRRVYARLAEALLVAHDGLARDGTLTRAGLRRHQLQVGEAARRAVTRQAAAIGRVAACVSPATVDGLVAGLDGAVEREAVRAALAGHGVRVVEPVALPAGAPTARYRQLTGALATLGLSLSAEAVLGAEAVAAGFTLRDGFRLRNGVRLGQAAIDRAQEALSRRSQDDRKAAAATVLSILRTEAATPGALDRLLLHEVAELLRRRVPAALRTQRQLAEEAAALGLDRGDADVLALSVVEAAAAEEPPPASAAAVEAALADGLLREAERLAARLPEEGDAAPARRRVAEVAGQVAALSGAASTAAAAGRSAEAAELLTRALRLARDDEALERALHGLPVPAPAGARAAADTERVVLAWTPSAAPAGTVHYRVIRAVGRHPISPADGLVVGDTEGNELTDPDPPPGQPLHYGVFATRGGTVWSAPAPVGPVTVVPERAPRAVTDLALARRPRAAPGTVEATWTPPRSGRALLRLSEEPPPWPPGAVVAAAEAERFGRPTGGDPARYQATGRAGVTSPPGRWHLTVLTAGRTKAAVGNSVEHTVASPVRGLTAERLGEVAQLRWVWPEGAAAVRVTWRQAGRPGANGAVGLGAGGLGGAGGRLEVPLRTFRDQGGARVTVGPGAVVLTVEPAGRDAGSTTTPVSVELDALPPVVSWRVRRTGWRRGRTVVELASAAPCRLPPLVVVGRPGTVLPLGPDHGEVVARVPAQDLRPGRPLKVTVATNGGRELALACFAEDGGGQVTLTRRREG